MSLSLRNILLGWGMKDRMIGSSEGGRNDYGGGRGIKKGGGEERRISSKKMVSAAVAIAGALSPPATTTATVAGDAGVLHPAVAADIGVLQTDPAANPEANSLLPMIDPIQASPLLPIQEPTQANPLFPVLDPAEEDPFLPVLDPAQAAAVRATLHECVTLIKGCHGMPKPLGAMLYVFVCDPLFFFRSLSLSIPLSLFISY
jgi:hypothetical protein